MSMRYSCGRMAKCFIRRGWSPLPAHIERVPARLTEGEPELCVWKTCGEATTSRIGWGTAGLGAAVLVTGVILRIVANNTDNVTVAAGPQLQPFAWAESQGGGFGVLGRF